MDAGELDVQITVQRKSVTQDPNNGEDVITWVPFATLEGQPLVAEKFWAQVQDSLPSRSESVQQGLNVGTRQARIRFRYIDGIDSSMRIIVHRDTDETYQIVGGPAQIHGRKAFIEVVAERYSTP